MRDKPRRHAAGGGRADDRGSTGTQLLLTGAHGTNRRAGVTSRPEARALPPPIVENATLGNFGVQHVTADQTWVTVSEGMWEFMGGLASWPDREPGVVLARIIWSQPKAF